MDDLTGLDWTASSPNTVPQKPPPMNPVSYYPLRPTPPLSGRSTPSSLQPPLNGFKPPVAPIPRSNNSTPANDSFANLVAFNVPPSKNLSLKDQQKVLEQKRVREQGQLRKESEIKFGGHEGEFWDRLGNGRVTPNPTPAPPTYTGTDEYGGQKLSNTINKPFAGLNSASDQQNIKAHANDDVDLLSTFDSSPADKANSLYKTSEDFNDIFLTGTNSQKPDNFMLASSQTSKGKLQAQRGSSNHDPFGLGATENTDPAQAKVAVGSIGDDDILGLLARPVSEFPPPSKAEELPSEPINNESFHPMDHAIAELVDMGFPTEKSKEALESTESGIDVQAAVGWLLNQAHEDSRTNSGPQKRPKDLDLQRTSQHRRVSVSSQSPDDILRPTWMREQSTKDLSRQSSRSPVNGEKEPGKYAAELGNNLFKTANTLWKTGTKKLNKAVSELNSDSDSSQPKWMRESQAKPEVRQSRPQLRQKINSDPNDPEDTESRRSKDKVPNVTDEALMLESGDNRPPPRKLPRQPKEVLPSWSSNSSRDQSPTIARPRESSLVQPRFSQQPRINDAKTKLSRQVIEDQSSNAYISPARRKKPAPKPPSPEPDLLFEPYQAAFKPSLSASSSKPSTPLKAPISTRSSPPRPGPKPRSIPQTSPSALRISTANRHEGTSAFKRGDYALATTHYTTALSALPSTHPLAIVILTNRALSHLKTGDPKSCVEDAKVALTLIGPSQGILESIDLGDEGSKDMKEFWTKAMTRQAEALEQLERWSDAVVLWRSCVEAGVGGTVSIFGRNRCEKAAAGPSQSTQPPKPAPPKRAPSKPIPKPSALAGLSTQTPQVSAEAVLRLRQANLEAERLDDEKFALSDQVGERLTQWRGGKEGNLRALLASLENVLWEGAGWKKVGMGELIAPGKVKIAYMKGIARVHPDKLSPSATTEQRMISAGVFAALNEAWDGFKRDNGL